ncbi:MAG: SPOR domain-containing protein [Bacteroidales bacterium]|nr:SPOR domain-containing protein [Bacteroidales bacterium]
MNDGLFVHEVAEQHHLSYDNALAAVSLAVNDIHKQIITKGKYKITGIGTLENVNAKSYEFTPLPYGVEAPDLYGLDSYYFAPIEEEVVETEAVADTADNAAMLQETEADDDRFTLSIPMSVIRYAAVAAVSAVFFFICIAPLNTAIHQGRSEASIFHSLWTLIAPQAPEIHQVSEKQQAPVKHQISEAQNISVVSQVAAAPQTEAKPVVKAQEATKAKLAQEQPAAVSQTVAKPAGPYTISIAAAIPVSGAEQMAATMKSNGHDKARVVKGKMVRVVYGSYATEADAKAELAKLRGTDPVFDQSWVLKLQ